MSKKRSFRGAFFMLCKIVSKYPSVFSPKFKARQSHHNDAFQRRFFTPGSSPGTRIALRSAPAARSLGSL